MALKNNNVKYEKATFAMGCFWGGQAIFDSIEGVLETTVGYTGGHTINPTYKSVCNDSTGHAEAIEILFDPKKVRYEKLLELFWMNHDPTTIDRQGHDIGSQYRSAIFYHNENQKKSAISLKEKFQKKLGNKPIVTEIYHAKDFYPAEEYHQKYYKTHNISCHIKYE
ncbi:peptide-methionine (S)-S-oxide reductase MsrA [Candidatus Pacearchaeota archaeon]|nr:peptide-methionine (S)-S-oxide reductase MsrA [Candidatus Pacearchaeota archaeon]